MIYQEEIIMNKLSIVCLVIVLLPFGVIAEEDYSKYPGYVDFSSLEGIDPVGESVEVYITKPIIKLVSAVNAGEDPELEKLLSGLALIRVEVFGIGENDAAQVEKSMNEMMTKLSKKNWEKIVKVRESDERVDVFLNINGETVEGLLVMVKDEDEATFVNIVGTLDMTLLGKLGNKFDIPNLDEIMPKKADPSS
jgi:Domain of unknown function (DUF4252)